MRVVDVRVPRDSCALGTHAGPRDTCTTSDACDLGKHARPRDERFGAYAPMDVCALVRSCPGARKF